MGGSASRLEIDRASFRRISIRVLTKSGRATANQLAVRLHSRIAESQGVNMVRIRVEYDAYNRTFKLVDREFGSILEDGAVYDLLAPLALLELEEDPALPSAESFCLSR